MKYSMLASLARGLVAAGLVGLAMACQNPLTTTPNLEIDPSQARATVSGTLLQEAEGYSVMSGVQLETCSEGGQNVGWIDGGDWMVYPITITTAGSYKISYRVASPNSGKSLQADLNANATALGSVAITNTGDWQSWATVSHTVTLPAGTMNFGVNAGTGGFNLNWIKFEYQAVNSGTKVEAESYSVMNGVITEACSDTGGGQNIGAIDAGDWMVYPLNIPTAGTYTIQYRVSSIYSGKSLQSDINAGATPFGSVAITNTGDWQNWTTVSQTVTLPAGSVNFGINGGTGGFNINWFSYTKTGDSDTGVPQTKLGKNLAWNDEFDYNGAPSSSRWSYDLGGGGWGNNELQTYTNSLSNSFVGNGILTIKSLKDGAGNWTSARLVSKAKGDWKFGYIEMRAKLPVGKGTWPAFWMLSTDWVYGGWPASGEIDIMEEVGYDPNVVHTTIHTETYNHTKGTQKVKFQTVPGANSGFHNYGCLWNDGIITWYIDDQPVFSVNRVAGDTYREWPFDQRFHILLNTAMGGNWGGAMGMDPALTSASFEIDWVRVYQ